MLAIIIEEKDALALIDKLELAAVRKRFVGGDPDNPPTWEEMHRVFHYEVVSWLQLQGASCVR